MSVRNRRLYFGFLSFFLVETLAGSSPLWILNPFYWFITYPLYMLHLLFFAHIAIKTNRTAFHHLYLWGMIIGLYETWITKVIWKGYGENDTFAMGALFGFGIHETIILLLFWHPLLAFILPLAISVKMMDPNNEKNHPFEDLRWFLSKEPYWKKLRLFLIIAGTATLAGNSGNPFIVLGTAIPGLIILRTGYRREIKSKEFSEKDILETFTLKKKGFRAVSGGMLFLYILGYVVLNYEFVPGLTQIIMTLMIYLIILTLIFKKKEVKSFADFSNFSEFEEVAINELTKLILVMVGIATLLSIIPIIGFVAFLIIIVLELPVSLVICYKNFTWKLNRAK